MTTPTTSTENKLTGDRYKDFLEALEILHIKDNISGRNQFTVAWPEAAAYIFGEELLQFDREGTTDRERRAALEDHASEKLLAFVEIVSTIEAKSVDKGALQIEYVQGLVNQLGRNLSLFIFSRWLVDRFIPPPPEETPAEAEVKEASSPSPGAQAAVAEEPPVQIPEDPMDRIKPISVEPEQSPPPVQQESPLRDDPQPETMPSREEEYEFASRPPPEEQGSIRPVEDIVPPKPAQGPDSLIVDMASASASAASAPVQQESMAPVVGSAKKPGLKLFKISEEGSGETGPGENQ